MKIKIFVFNMDSQRHYYYYKNDDFVLPDITENRGLATILTTFEEVEKAIDYMRNFGKNIRYDADTESINELNDYFLHKIKTEADEEWKPIKVWDKFAGEWCPLPPLYFRSWETFSIMTDDMQTLPISKNTADNLLRTGKHGRNLALWANIYQVKVEGHLCDLYYYDNGKILIQNWSDL